MRYLRPIVMAMMVLGAMLLAQPTSNAEPDEPVLDGPDFEVVPPEAPGEPGEGEAPGATQTSEFLAGKIVYSMVFVESSGGAGNCSPADTQSENWSIARRNDVLIRIAAGLEFWTARPNGPIRSFVQDNRGAQPTSCEPITRTAGAAGQENLWIADVLTAMGFPATPSNYIGVARSFVDSRRDLLGADWGFTIFVVDSLNDDDGCFAPGPNCLSKKFAYTKLNGPFMVMTYDNDGWGIDDMNLVTAHETGHIFGALDEYASSNCSTADTWGYLNAANASCNNGGITTDISIMGEGPEWRNPNVDVSASARGAIGWRNPTIGDAGRTLVDVVQNASATTVSGYLPDPSPDTTPTYRGIIYTNSYPPGGCNTVGGVCWRYPQAVSISKVERAERNLDGGAFTAVGVAAADGAFDEETEGYTLTPTSPVSYGTHTFGARSVTIFGDISSTGTDTLTISADCDSDGVLNVNDVDADCDHFWNDYETRRGSDPGGDQSTPERCDLLDNDGDTAVDEAPAGVDWDLDGDGFKDCIDGDIDTDGDSVINLLDYDDDGDGFTDLPPTDRPPNQELYMSTDHLGDCSANSGHDAYPPDVNGDRQVLVNDAIILFLGKVINPAAYDARSDANGDGQILVNDVILLFLGKVLTKCTVFTFTNNTSGSVDDIHLEWSTSIAEVFSALDSDLAGWSDRTLSGDGLTLHIARPDARGDLANGGEVKIVVRGANPLTSSCQWTLDGVNKGAC